MLLMNVDISYLQTCIDACIKCAQTCNRCFKQLLEEPDIQAKKEVIALLVDCAEMCYAAAAFMSRDNSVSPELISSCAELCEKCAALLKEHNDMHCKASVEACQQCAIVCRSLL